MFRAAGPYAARATKLMIERMQGFFADQGLRGQDVFLHISNSETPGQRCPRWQEGLDSVKATPAERFKLEIR